MAKPQVHSVQDFLNVAEKYAIPLEKIRFFVGKDCREPKCFGMYKDRDGRWIVYKNKADGSRAVRYQGYSEAEAAGILFDKLDEEIRTRRKQKAWWNHQEQMVKDSAYAYEYEKEIAARKDLKIREPHKSVKKKKKNLLYQIFGGTGMIVIGLGLLMDRGISAHPSSGYYTDVSDIPYVFYHNQWYMYDNDYWDPVYDVTDYDSFDYQGTYWDGGTFDTSFEDTDYFGDSWYSGSSYSDDSDDYRDWSDDYDRWDDDYDDDDYDYDWDDWDFGDTDWESDW